MRTQLLSCLAAIGLTATAAAGPASEVTVIGQRLKLESRVESFVYSLAALENDEGLARWNAPVCPRVTGLPRTEGEFVLERVSEIARAAGVPLAGEDCRPNLFILVTSQPKELLQAMDQQRHAVVFGNALPLTVAAFIDTPQPVKVWFNSREGAATGDSPLSQGVPPSAQVLGGGAISAFSAPTFSNTGAMGASRLVSQVVWTVSYAYVVVDQARLPGVSRGQFADYVGMVSLAQIKRHAHTGQAPTILNLFDGAPQAAPAGMSDWDQAFLRSLYGTAQDSKIQRSLITRAMVRELIR